MKKMMLSILAGIVCLSFGACEFGYAQGTVEDEAGAIQSGLVSGGSQVTAPGKATSLQLGSRPIFLDPCSPCAIDHCTGKGGNEWFDCLCEHCRTECPGSCGEE